jgi:hypothetical protein
MVQRKTCISVFRSGLRESVEIEKTTWPIGIGTPLE